MFRIIKATFFSFLLFAITITYTLPSFYQDSSQPFNISENKLTRSTEKQVEVNYIEQDSFLTSQINFNTLIKKIQTDLNTYDFDKSRLLNKYPQILSINKRDNNSNKFNVFPQSITFSPILYQGFDTYKLVTIPIKKNNTVNFYEFKIRLNLSEIQMKQQLRMFTVTHLQNNKWETIPTKYKPNKLSLGLDNALPDLSPSEEQKGISHYIKNEVVIKFKPGISDKRINEILNKYQLNLKKRHDHIVIANCPRRNTKTLLSTIKNSDDYAAIEYVEPHFIYLTNEQKRNNSTYPFIPNDSLYIDYQWNLPSIKTEEGWELTKGKENVIIAVVDTGVDLNHPEFVGKLVDGYNVIDPNKPPMDDDGHGTHVAGIIAANTNNQEGIAGITWYNRIMPIKVLDQSGAGTLFDVAEGIIWAVDHGAKVINMSLGNYAESKYLHDAIQYAFNKDVVLIAATGNDNTNELGFPAAYKEVIGVSAIDPQLKKAPFSNYGSYVDVVAPGVSIASTYPNNQYAALSGTSMASPHVAALAGLIRAYNPNLSSSDVIKIIKETSTDLGDKGKDQYYGYGQINLFRAIEHSMVKKDLFIEWLIKNKVKLILGQSPSNS